MDAGRCPSPALLGFSCAARRVGSGAAATVRANQAGSSAVDYLARLEAIESGIGAEKYSMLSRR